MSAAAIRGRHRRYSGQYIALVLAATMDQARAAAAAVRVTYRNAKPDVSPDLADGFTDHMKVVSTRGDIDEALTRGTVTLDHTYITPIEVHNPIEMHASVADWDGTRLHPLRVHPGRHESPGRLLADARRPAGKRHHRDEVSSVPALAANSGRGRTPSSPPPPRAISAARLSSSLIAT